MPYSTLQPQQVTAFLQQDKAIILDYRDAGSWQADHLPGAVQVTDSLIRTLTRAHKDDPILVYCYHGVSSHGLASLLTNFGCHNVFNLEGGWQAWTTFRDAQTVPLTPLLLRWLEDNGFDPDDLNSRIDNGMSPLMLAARLAEREFVEELLHAGVDVNLVNDDQNNALWFACFSEDTKIIHMLIEWGIDVSNRNVNGATSLIYAASAGKLAVVQSLVEAGADLHCSTLDGFTALDSASTWEILRFLRPCYNSA